MAEHFNKKHGGEAKMQAELRDAVALAPCAQMIEPTLCSLAMNSDSIMKPRRRSAT
jgi:hypothetical protein